MSDIGCIVHVLIFVGILIHVLIHVHRVVLLMLVHIDAVMHVQGIPLNPVAVFYLGAHVFNDTRGASRRKACTD